MRIGWYNVVRRPGRVLATGLAFTLAMLAIVLIQGFRDGLYETYTGLIRHTPVDLWVGEAGVKTPVNTFSVVPASLAAEVAAVPGVRAVVPLYAVPVIADAGWRRVPMMLYGFDLETGLGGPWRLASGRLPGAAGEIVLDQGFARQNGLRQGGTFRIFGRDLRITGLSLETNSFMSAAAFADGREVARLVQAPDQVSFLLVRLEPGADAAAVQAAVPGGYAVYTPGAFRRSSEETLGRVMGAPLQLLLGVAFLTGMAVIALSTYAGVLERRQEFGVLRALGMSGPGLFTAVVTEVMAGAAVGIVLGAVLAALAALAMGAYIPAYPVVITGAGLGRTAAMGLVMGLVAALAPIWRLSRMDPAGVFRV